MRQLPLTVSHSPHHVSMCIPLRAMYISESECRPLLLRRPGLFHRLPAEFAWHKKADPAMMALLGYAGFDNPQMPEIIGQPRVWTQLCEPLPTFTGIAPAYEVYKAAV